MKLLLSNDDGVHAPGLACLAAQLEAVAEVRVLAPDRDRSGASNALTLDRPLELVTQTGGFCSVNGTPTDAVHLGVSPIFGERPDMVVAGLNAGANLGDDVLYSGTVAAAMEGRYLRYPALALSMVGRDIEHYETGARVALSLVRAVTRLELAPRTVLNVNVPDCPWESLRGFQVTRLGHRDLAAHPVESVDPRGRRRFWIGAASGAADRGPGTDFHALEEGWVSVTPLHADRTQYAGMDPLRLWLEALA